MGSRRLNKLIRKLTRGYQWLGRDRHLLFKELGLTDAECRLWELYDAVSGWDEKYPDYFRKVEATDTEIAFIWGCSDSKVNRVRNSLAQKIELRQIEDGFIEVPPIPRKSLDPANMRNNTASMQETNSKLQKGLASLQQNRGYYDESFILAYEGKKSVISEEQYKNIKSRVEEIEKILENKLFKTDAEMQNLIKEHTKLSDQLLDYEIGNDLIPV